MTAPPKSYPPSYCTNVHRGADYADVMSQLNRWAPRIKEKRLANTALGLGLWFSDRAIQEALQPQNLAALQRWLEQTGMIAFTANAFPYGDFHQAVVKHSVYEPDWSSSARTRYTNDVFQLLHAVAPIGLEISASTLPLGWPRGVPSAEFLRACARELVLVCRELEKLEQATGRLGYLCIEPEPGCILDSSEDVIQFFDEWLLPATSAADALRRHVRVCHDVCHSAVMFEPQSEAVQKLRQAGIAIGKVQVSAALEADFGGRRGPEFAATREALAQFCEPKFLHQTSIRHPDGKISFYQDLPDALDHELSVADSCWRVHFHVPIHWNELGAIRSTQSEIRQFLSAIADDPMPPLHYEVETYAWQVLPQNLRSQDLSAGIAAELDWFESIRRGL